MSTGLESTVEITILQHDSNLQPSTVVDINSSHEDTDPRQGEEKTLHVNKYMFLYRAALEGDWEYAKRFILYNQDAVTIPIASRGETVLQIAVGAKQERFVAELVELMCQEDLEKKNNDGNTALCIAAASGNTKIAEVLVGKNKDLPTIRNYSGQTPLYIAASYGHGDMVRYLYNATNDGQTEDRIELLCATITTDLYDVALHILNRDRNLAFERNRENETALHVLARKPSAFASGRQLSFWQWFIDSCIHVELNDSPQNSCKSYEDGAHKITDLAHMITHSPIIRSVYNRKLLHIQALEIMRILSERVFSSSDSEIKDIVGGIRKVLSEQVYSLSDSEIRKKHRDPLRRPPNLLCTAAELGNVDFITRVIQFYPNIICEVNENGHTIFHAAVAHRQEKVFSLIHEIGALKDIIALYTDNDGNNILHLAGKLAPSAQLNKVSAPVLQMQQELQWFKEVEKIVQPSYREMRNCEGRKPRDIFSATHKNLVEKGKQWNKDIASSCIVVATLIATVAFAALLTVPGGNDEKGIPTYLHTTSFLVFAIFDALALFSSVTSVLMFMYISMCRYAEEDFLESLPKTLMTGLVTLFFSISTTIIAFSATLFIILRRKSACAIPIVLLASLPFSFVILRQFPLLIDMIHCTQTSSLFHRPKKNSGISIFEDIDKLL